MKRNIFLFILLALPFVCQAEQTSDKKFERVDYMEGRLGWSIGGTMPVNMPASIRSINSYSLCPNIQLGFNVGRRFHQHWGIEIGANLENKGMKTDAKVKNYQMSMVQGGESISGLFTGNVVTETSGWQILVPVRAAFWANDNIKIKFGPYLAFGLSRKFSGYAYDGYLRKDTPTGAKIEIGSTEEDRGSYDFSSDLRDFNFGLDLGADFYVTRRLAVFADLTWGLNSAFKSTFKTIDQSMYPIYGTIGLAYRIK